MQGGQGPPGGPGRGIYIARRIVAAIVVLFILALVSYWAWQTLLSPTPESGSKAPESAGVSSSAEETIPEEGSTTTTEEIVISEVEPQEGAQARTEGPAESPEVVDLTPAAVPPISAAPVALEVNTLPASTTSSLPSPPVEATNEAMNLPAQISPGPPTIPEPQIGQPIASEEPVSVMEPTEFNEGPPLGETAFAQQAPVEGPALERGASANVTATAGDTVATSGRGAIATSGTVTAVAG